MRPFRSAIEFWLIDAYSADDKKPKGTLIPGALWRLAQFLAKHHRRLLLRAYSKHIVVTFS
jgi:hypothetical protein